MPFDSDVDPDLRLRLFTLIWIRIRPFGTFYSDRYVSGSEAVTFNSDMDPDQAMGLFTLMWIRSWDFLL